MTTAKDPRIDLTMVGDWGTANFHTIWGWVSAHLRWRSAPLSRFTIRTGTLTHAERETINHHIVATNRMLESLPWPKHLRHVPEYAGGHHERVDGAGYPRGLKRGEMSIQARIMGIADIFEALTARDRPYKQGMKLSQALRVLERFSRDGHIDPDLFDVFVKRQVYLQYARQYLDPSQIDLLNC